MIFSYRQLRYFFGHKIWCVDDAALPPFRRMTFNLLRKAVLTTECYIDRNLSSHASALAYSTTLAAVPILAIVFAMCRSLGYSAIIEDKIRESLGANPEFADTILNFINSYLHHTQNGIFIGFGLLVLLYTIVQLTISIEAALNTVWNVKNQRSVYRQITDYISVFFLMPVLIIISNGLSIFFATIAADYPDFMVLSTTVKVVLKLSPYVLSGLLFTALYTYMPNTDIRMRHAIMPGFIAGAAFQLLQYFYIHSQMWVSSYNAIYGSFAILPLFMLWVNFSWMICLLGAQLSYANQNLKSYYYIKDIHKVSRSYHDMLILLLMTKICQRMAKGMLTYTVKGLAAETNLPAGVVTRLVHELQDLHMVVIENSDGDGNMRMVPAEDINRLTVNLLLERIDNYGDSYTPSAGESGHRLWQEIMALRSRFIGCTPDVLLKDI